MHYGRGAHESVSVSVQNVRWIDKRVRLLSASAGECYVLLCVLSLGVQLLVQPALCSSRRILLAVVPQVCSHLLFPTRPPWRLGTAVPYVPEKQETMGLSQSLKK